MQKIFGVENTYPSNITWELIYWEIFFLKPVNSLSNALKIGKAKLGMDSGKGIEYNLPFWIGEYLQVFTFCLIPYTEDGRKVKTRDEVRCAYISMDSIALVQKKMKSPF